MEKYRKWRSVTPISQCQATFAGLGTGMDAGSACRRALNELEKKKSFLVKDRALL